MKIRIAQLDGQLPNLALMKLSAWHKSRGDDVHFFRGAAGAAPRSMLEPDYDRSYASAIFKFSQPLIEEFKHNWPDGIIGGTGTDNWTPIESITGDFDGLDYDITSPNFTASIGFTQRGCRLACKFCVVPKKEGKQRHSNTVAELWRGDPWPKHLHLLDNDFFGGPHWRERIREIRDGDFKVSFTQGINVRKINDEVAEAIASIDYQSPQFKQKLLITAWDNLKDEKIFFDGVDCLEKNGVPPGRIQAYMLIGFDKNETMERILYRFWKMRERGIRPYPMRFDRSRPELLKFQQWALSRAFSHTRFEDFEQNQSIGQLKKDIDDLFDKPKELIGKRRASKKENTVSA